MKTLYSNIRALTGFYMQIYGQIESGKEVALSDIMTIGHSLYKTYKRFKKVGVEVCETQLMAEGINSSDFYWRKRLYGKKRRYNRKEPQCLSEVTDKYANLLVRISNAKIAAKQQMTEAVVKLITEGLPYLLKFIRLMPISEMDERLSRWVVDNQNKRGILSYDEFWRHTANKERGRIERFKQDTGLV